MKTKTIKIPIYNNRLVVISTDNFEEINQKYNTQITDNYDAVVFNIESGEVFAVFKPNPEYHIIVHECIHIVNKIFEFNGVELDLYNDETQAYLTEWIFKQVCKATQKSPN